MKFITAKILMTVKGHILNAPWGGRIQRRLKRGFAIREVVGKYLDKYASGFRSISPANPEPRMNVEGERIFSIWFQGEETAPEIVQACWRSIRANCTMPLVILDENTIFDWIGLPEEVVEKWRSGKIRHAHFADLCRLELLYQYGGFWLDATDFISSEFPQWLLDEDFFVHMSGEKQRGFHSFVQNCFIRAKKGNFLIQAWRDAALIYWKNEDKAVDYFIHQLIFKKVVEENPLAQVQFERMPKVNQDAAHTIWFDNAETPYDKEMFDSLAAAALFQKTEFKSSNATNPKPGSFAEAVMNRYK